MKLLELVEPSFKEVTTKGKDFVRSAERARSAINTAKNMDRMGAGLYATVGQHRNRPGVVTKIGSPVQDINKDAYYSYVKAISSNKRIANNPYFPRIYSVKVLHKQSKDDPDKVWWDIERDENSFYVIEMEQLESIKAASLDELEMLADRMFFNFNELVKSLSDKAARSWGPGDGPKGRVAANNKKRLTKGSKPNPEDKLPDNVKHQLYVSVIAELLDEAAFGKTGMLIHVKDPLLKQALLIIKSLFKQEKGTADIHPGNIMLRRTAHGVQLVITDPIA